MMLRRAQTPVCTHQRQALHVEVAQSQWINVVFIKAATCCKARSRLTGAPELQADGAWHGVPCNVGSNRDKLFLTDILPHAWASDHAFWCFQTLTTLIHQ